MNTSLTDSLSQIINTPAVSPVELSVFDLATKGGWIMIVLLALSVLAIYLFIAKLLQIKAAGREDHSFMDRIKDYIHEGKIDAAIRLCEDRNTPYARMIHKGITRLGRPMNDILVTIENTGNIEIGRLENGMALLATIAAGAPMIGFLGTVTGMIRAFFDMANAGQAGVDVTLLSNGIYEALVTTVAGLIVGIITLFAYNFLVARLDKVINQMETKTLAFMDLLNEPAV